MLNRQSTSRVGILFGALFANAFATTLLEISLLKQISFLVPSWSIVLTIVFLSFMVGTGVGSLWAWYKPEMKPHLYWWPFFQGFGTLIALIGLLRFGWLYQALPNLFLLGLCFSGPFVCFGYLLSVCLHWARRSHASAVGVLYASDLIGAALGITSGTFLFIPLFGMNKTVLLASGGFFLSAGLLAFPRRGGMLAAGFMLALLAVLSSLEIDSFLERNREFIGSTGPGNIKELKDRILYTGWSPLQRIDVIDEDQRNLLSLAYNGQIWTAVPKITDYDPARVARFVGSYPYADRPQHVLILGSGAGLDLLYAKMAHLDGKQKGIEVATDITAVEIDPLVVKLMAQDFSSYNQGIYNDPLVTTQVIEARYYLRNTEKLYDLIYYPITDTPLLVAGSFWGSELKIENYLYTVEGLRYAFERLSPQGKIIILTGAYGLPDVTRFREDRLVSGAGGFDKLCRFLATAKATLEQSGIKEWATHVRMVLYGSEPQGQFFTAALVEIGKSPLPALPPTLSLIPDSHLAHYHDTESSLKQLQDRFPLISVPRDALIQGAEREQAVTDDRPFFYTYPFDQVPRLILSTLQGSSLFLIVFLAASVALLRRSHEEVGWGLSLALWSYFTCVGVSYMMAEILYANAASLFLNHAFAGPAVLIFGFLLFGGLGSAFSSRMNAQATLTLFVILAAYNLLLAGSIRSLGAALAVSSLPMKSLAFLGLLFPLAFALGVFLPTGIQVVQERQWEIAVGWIYALDVVASIVGLLAGIALPFKLGYSWSLYVLSLFFLGQSLLLWRLRRTS